MTEAAGLANSEMPGGGTSQSSGASQAAAAPAEAAPQSAAERLYDSAANPAQQQQASEGKEPAAAEPEAAKGEQPAGRAPEAEEGLGKQAQAPQGAPEQYEFKPVEGVQLSEEVTAKFSQVARELNLSQDAAQKMLNEVAPAIAHQQRVALHTLNEQWVNAVQADKEIGGDKLKANLAIARKARDAFGTDGLRTLLKESPLGNHPEMIRFFVRAGQAISEDKFVPGGSKPPSGGKDAATVLYGKSN